MYVTCNYKNFKTSHTEKSVKRTVFTISNTDKVILGVWHFKANEEMKFTINNKIKLGFWP